MPQGQKDIYLPAFSSKSFEVWSFRFESLIYVELLDSRGRNPIPFCPP